MTATLIDGKTISAQLKVELAEEVSRLKAVGIQPGLAVVLVGEDPASQVYVRNKERTCLNLGMHSEVYRLAEETTEAELLSLVQKLNQDPKIHGILVQLPLPNHLDDQLIIESISPDKDVDGFHPSNVGKLSIGEGKFYASCTPAGVIELLKKSNIEIAGKHAVVIGRSNIVGKPVALLLLQEHATVTICHSKTTNMDEITKQADILIVAIGRADFIKGDHVKPGAVVIDVGMNRKEDGKLTGDVDFEQVKKVASYITPVPGGVGPMTIAMLMKNTIEAAK